MLRVVLAPPGLLVLVLGVTLTLVPFISAVIVWEDTSQCDAYGTSIKCDFLHSPEVVNMDDAVNKFEEVLVLNVNELQLHPGVCSSLYLHHIRRITYTSSSQLDASCPGKALHLMNVTIDYVPPFLHTFTMQDSRLTHTFLSQPHLSKLKLSTSIVEHIELDYPVAGDGHVRLHKVNLTSLISLTLTERSRLFITDSVIHQIQPSAIKLSENTSAEIMRTTFLQKDEAKIELQTDATITMANITGWFTIVYHRNNTYRQDQSDASTSPAPLCVPTIYLSLLLVLSLLVNVWVMIKGKCSPCSQVKERTCWEEPSCKGEEGQQLGPSD
ncbi:uncharacterized protein LOC121871391 [Homarus americanus]|uniref:Uncharacterized protein n=1 Tax=Homarus americanus TaxID=6706 RepID=A0A8J5JUT0_HOMAM|nr:uncharacterized protein LOC121871391 [Homarus americanus]KAG7164611.1 hypothetical protein Hamer_G004996 [Homarus americanus]